MKRFNVNEYCKTPVGSGEAKCIDNKIEYAIDEKAGKVTAYIKHTKYHPIEFLVSCGLVLDWEMYDYGCNRDFQSVLPHLVINSSYSGRAQLHPEDEWDVEKGKEIAKARCLCSYNDAMSTAIYHYCMYLYRKMERAGNIQNSFYDATIKWAARDPRYEEKSNIFED